MNDPLYEAKDLIARAGMSAFLPTSSAFTSTADSLYPTEVVKLNLVQPIVRGTGVPNFNEQRALSILHAIRNNIPIAPVKVYAFAKSPFEYQLFDGFHRYYLSLALGFTEIPAGINPWRE